MGAVLINLIPSTLANTNLISGATITQTQGGTAGAPTNERPFSIQPRSTTDGLTKAAFVLRMTSNLFNSTWDEVLDVGYNADANQPALPTARWSVESDYEDSPGFHQMEMHGQYSSLGGGSGTTYRWLTSSFRAYTTLRGNAALNWKDGSGGDTGVLTFGEATASTVAFNIATSGVTMQTPGIAFLRAWGVYTITGDVAQSNVAPNDITAFPQRAFATATGANRQAGQFIVDLGPPTNGGTTETNFFIRRASNGVAVFSVRADGACNWSNLVLGATSFLTVYHDGATHVQGGVGTLFLDNTAAARDTQMNTAGASGILLNGQAYATVNGVQLFNSNTTAFGGGNGVLGIHNAVVVPNANPSGGGVQYANAGANTWRGSNGTITTMAPA